MIQTCEEEMNKYLMQRSERLSIDNLRKVIIRSIIGEVIRHDKTLLQLAKDMIDGCKRHKLRYITEDCLIYPTLLLL